MRARILFQSAAFFALVLGVAAIPSRATDRRDPLIYQDAVQSANSCRGTENAIKPVKHAKKAVHAAKKPSSQAAKRVVPSQKTPGGSSAGR